MGERVLVIVNWPKKWPKRRLRSPMQDEKVTSCTRGASNSHALRRRNLNPPGMSPSVVYGRFRGAPAPRLGALGDILAQGWPGFWDGFGGRSASADGRPQTSPTVAILHRSGAL